jgi:hypothetical protein
MRHDNGPPEIGRHSRHGQILVGLCRPTETFIFVTHTIEDHDGQTTEGLRPGDGILTVDPFILGVLALETVNFALLAYIIYWTIRAGDRILNRLSQSLGLNRGKNPSILSGVRAHLTPRLPQPASEPLEGELIPSNGGGIDLTNVSMDQLQGLAKQYLGNAANGGGDSTGIQLAQKFLNGSLKQGDITQAIPWFLSQIRSQPGQPQLPSSSTSRWD